MKEKLLGKSPEELLQVVSELGMPRFSAKQIARWLYVAGVASIDDMTDLSKESRAALSRKFDVGNISPTQSFTSSDGTVKYLFDVVCPTPDGERESIVEAVMIPDGERRTLCVSSQAGCRMGCKFCMTGRGGWHGNLDAAQILSQILSVPEASELTNVVFMGMGEPLDNYANVSKVLTAMCADWGLAWSPKRITVSSIGVIPNLKRFLDEHKCHLAISLHNPFPEERLSLMPVQAAWDLRDVVALLRQYDFTGQRRVSFEYTMFEGFNDTRRHADALCRLLKGLECRVNMIRFHKIPDFQYTTSSAQSMELFRERLNRGGITATVRASRGEDIMAACGLLAGKAMNEDNNYSRTLDYCRKLCSAREYAPKDIRDKAMKRLNDAEMADAIVGTLTDEGYLSALRYACAFARDKSAIAGWGPVKIKYMLRSKGIDDAVVSEAIGEIDSDSADKKLTRILTVKKKALGSDPQLRPKLLRFALSRGYDYDTAVKTIAEIIR